MGAVIKISPTLLLVSLLTLITAPALHATAQEGEFPSSITVNTNARTEPHSLFLKAIQGGNGQTFNVEGFRLDSTNIISAQSNSQLIVFSSELMEKAKVKPSGSENRIDLQKIGFNTFSIGNLPAGVYTLDLLVNKDNRNAAYEGILVIGQASQELIEKEITNQNTNVNVRLVFQDTKPKPDNKEIVCLYHPENPLCSPDKNGKCPSGWGTNDDGQCFPANKKCPSGSARMDNDETGACIPFNKIKYDDRCPSGSANPQEGCTLEGYHCTPEQGCGYYSHGVCETCVPRNIPMLTQALTNNNNDTNTTSSAALIGGSGGANENGDLPLCDGSFQDCRTESGQVCEAGTTENGCELEGYHCTEDEGCGSFSDGICIDCDTNEEVEEGEEDPAIDEGEQDAPPPEDDEVGIEEGDLDASQDQEDNEESSDDDNNNENADQEDNEESSDDDNNNENADNSDDESGN